MIAGKDSLNGFFELLQNNQPFFSLKLCYKGERLTQAVLDGSSLELLDERDADGFKHLFTFYSDLK